MCQLCQVTTIASKDRWPSPVEPSVAELRSLVPRTHSDDVMFKARTTLLRKSQQQIGILSVAFSSLSVGTSNAAPTTSTGLSSTMTLQAASSTATSQDSNKQTDDIRRAREKLILDVKSLFTAIDLIEEAREAWWNSEPKKQQRRQWLEELQTDKLARLNAVNNKCNDMIVEMRALLGRYGKWVLGVEESLET